MTLEALETGLKFDALFMAALGRLQIPRPARWMLNVLLLGPITQQSSNLIGLERL